MATGGYEKMNLIKPLFAYVESCLATTMLEVNGFFKSTAAINVARIHIRPEDKYSLCPAFRVDIVNPQYFLRSHSQGLAVTSCRTYFPRRTEWFYGQFVHLLQHGIRFGIEP
jgi:hypothetical protein